MADASLSTIASSAAQAETKAVTDDLKSTTEKLQARLDLLEKDLSDQKKDIQDVKATVETSSAKVEVEINGIKNIVEQTNSSMQTQLLTQKTDLQTMLMAIMGRFDKLEKTQTEAIVAVTEEPKEDVKRPRTQ